MKLILFYLYKIKLRILKFALLVSIFLMSYYLFATINKIENLQDLLKSKINYSNKAKIELKDFKQKLQTIISNYPDVISNSQNYTELSNVGEKKIIISKIDLEMKTSYNKLFDFVDAISNIANSIYYLNFKLDENNLIQVKISFDGMVYEK